MKCLVTGASGLLGHEICRQLKNSNHEVWAIDNGFRSHTKPSCDVFIEKDLIDCFDTLPIDFDIIYHMAAINGTDYFYSMPLTVLTNNLNCDLKLFSWAEKCIKLKNLIYASSSEVVSGSTENGIVEKTTVTIDNIHNARWSYRLPKIVAENYLSNSNLPWIIIRYYNVYGPLSKFGHFVADQIYNQQKGIFKVIGPQETRSFCYVSDAVLATINLIGKADFKIVNVGSDEEILVFDAAKIISNNLSITNPTWEFMPGRIGSSVRRVPDISLLKKLLPNYKHRSFQQGIQETILSLEPNKC
jgi:UDP-glucose 4-epimerase